jgi:uncharacterized membrane protein
MSSEPTANPSWGDAAKYEPRWPAALAVVIALGLYLALPDRLILGPVWVVPALELAILIPLMIFSPKRLKGEPAWRRGLAITLIAIVTIANIVSLGLLVRALVIVPAKFTGLQLILSATGIWLTNVIVFALWYWELDRGGPGSRLHADHREPDFLFPQMVTPSCGPHHWSPQFLDYVFVSFTNATAFSPTDTMPLTPSAKLLFMAQSITALLTIALVAARAVNILS